MLSLGNSWSQNCFPARHEWHLQVFFLVFSLRFVRLRQREYKQPLATHHAWHLVTSSDLLHGSSLFSLHSSVLLPFVWQTTPMEWVWSMTIFYQDSTVQYAKHGRFLAKTNMPTLLWHNQSVMHLVNKFYSWYRERIQNYCKQSCLSMTTTTKYAMRWLNKYSNQETYTCSSCCNSKCAIFTSRTFCCQWQISKQ